MKLTPILSLFFSVLMLVSACKDSIPDGSTTTPVPPTEDKGLQVVDAKYTACLAPIGNETFDIVSWNIEQFPKSNSTISLVNEIIKNANPDIIAVQEISDIAEFNKMASALEGWKGVASDMGFLSLGYLYKTSEVSLVGNVEKLYGTENYYFPREPLKATFMHKKGLTITLLNIHLKAQESGNTDEQRREEASKLLKLYIDTNLHTENVLVLGDFNDLLSDPASENVFQNFIDDANNYKFTDMDIALGSSAYWSYPSWPSHLDHLLITNELFGKHQATNTLRIDQCESNYDRNVSDHRPMLIRFNPLP